MKQNRLRRLRDLALVILLLVVATTVGAIFHHLGFHKTNVVVVYIFSVLLIARFTKGYFCGILASVISLLLFNWFFTEPYFTFKVNDMTYIITFGIMTLTAIFTSALTTKAKQAAEEERERENESNALYQMTNHLTDAEGVEAIAEITVRSVSEVLGCAATAGGIKRSRVYLTLRLCALQIKRKISPNSKIESPEYVKATGKTPIDKEVAEDTTGFVMAYLLIYVVGSLAMTVTAGCTLTEAMFDFASSLSTVGLSIGITGPTTNDATLIVEMIGMLLGRLEIFIVVIGFTFGFGKLKSLCRRRTR